MHNRSHRIVVFVSEREEMMNLDELEAASRQRLPEVWRLIDQAENQLADAETALTEAQKLLQSQNGEAVAYASGYVCSALHSNNR